MAQKALSVGRFVVFQTRPSGIYKKSMKIAGQGIVARIEELGKERELSDQELAMHDMFVNGKGDPASWDISEIVSYFSE